MTYVLTLNEIFVVDYATIVKIDMMFVVDYATMPLKVDIQRFHCRTFNSIVVHSTMNAQQSIHSDFQYDILVYITYIYILYI